MRLIINGLGEVDASWRERRIKDIGTLVLGKMLQETPGNGLEFRRYLKAKNVGWLSGNLEDVEEMFFSDTEMKSLRLRNDDLVFAEGGDVGKTFIWKGEISECYIQNSVQKLTLKEGFDPRYYLYVSYTLGHNGYYRAIVNQVSIMHLTREKLLRVSVPFPPFGVQQKIVAYLDEKTAAIDARVAVLERKLAAFRRLKTSVINEAVTGRTRVEGAPPRLRVRKMKDSGVDWIGPVPEEWEVKRIKDIGWLYSGLTGKSRGDFEVEGCDHGKPYVPFTNIYNNFRVSVDDVRYVSIVKGERQNRVILGDILFLMSSEDFDSIGKPSVISDPVPELYLNSFCRGMRVTKEYAVPEFVAYYLCAESVRTVLRVEARGFTRINLKVDRLASQAVVMPPLSEQRAIVAYLDAECAKIDKMAALVTREIELYKKLKRSLINEVVTGKRQVV